MCFSVSESLSEEDNKKRIERKQNLKEPRGSVKSRSASTDKILL